MKSPRIAITNEKHAQTEMNGLSSSRDAMMRSLSWHWSAMHHVPRRRIAMSVEVRRRRASANKNQTQYRIEKISDTTTRHAENACHRHVTSRRGHHERLGAHGHQTTRMNTRNLFTTRQRTRLSNRGRVTQKQVTEWNGVGSL